MERQKKQNSQNNLEKIVLKEFEEHAQFDYKLNHKAKLTTVHYWHKDKHIKQWR